MFMVKKFVAAISVFSKLKSGIIAYFFLEINELANMPRPNPNSMDPTKYSAD